MNRRYYKVMPDRGMDMLSQFLDGGFAEHFELKTRPVAREMPYLNLEPKSTSLEVVLIADTNEQTQNYELRNS